MRAELHPSEHLLIDFLLGKVPDAEQSAVEAHLAECVACQEWAATLYPADTFVELLAAARTHNDLSRATAATPSLSPLSTPTLAWQAPELPVAIPRDLPPVLANHPKYDPVLFLGAGGMGSVWLAKHTVMNRQVAVKVIRPDLSARPQAASRFIREIQAAGMLKCDYIVTAYDAEEIDGSCLLVMEYVPGQNLAEVLRSGPLPVSEACRAARDAAQGLAHAHAAGYVHRDVKPSNLIRTPEGITKVLDFGLVTAEVEGSSQLSAENMVIGTPDYIAPEQIEQPQTADARSDVYSLGCTLYHLLSGSAPYPVNSAIKKLDAHRDPAMLPAPLTGVPPELAAVVTKMLAKKPGDRFPCAMDVAAALEPFVSGAVDGTRVLAPKRAVAGRSSTRWLIAAGLLFAVAGLLAGGVVYKIQYDNTAITLETDDRDIEVVMKRNGELVRIVDTKTTQAWNLDTKKLRLKADGSELSIELPGREPLVLRRNGNVAVTIRRQGQKETSAFEVVHTIPFEFKWLRNWSPDSKRFVVGTPAPDNKVEYIVWDAATAKRLGGVVLPVAMSQEVAFLGNGEELLVQLDRSISRWNWKTGNLVAKLSDIPPSQHSRLADVSSDGSRYAATLFAVDGANRHRVVVYDSANGKVAFEVKPLTPKSLLLDSPRFSPDGSLLVTLDTILRDGPSAIQLRKAATGELVKSIPFKGLFQQQAEFGRGGKTITAQVMPPTRTGVCKLKTWDIATGEPVPEPPTSFDRLGVLIGDSHGRPAMFEVDQAGFFSFQDGVTGAKSVWSPTRGPIIDLANSPDGKHVLLCQRDKLTVLRLPRPLPLTPAPMREAKLPLQDGECHVFRGHTDGLLALAVSPDGKYAVTGGSYPESKDSALRLWNLHTGEEVRQFQGHTSLIYSVAFSPDGKKVLSASGDGTARLWDVERGIEIGTLSDVKPRGAKYGIAFSPDGERAIATSQRPLLYDVASRKELALFEEYTVGQVRAVALSPDGTTLATGDSNGDGSYEVVTLWDMKSGKRIGSLDEHKWLMYALAWSPEGTRLASASHDSTVRVWDPNTGRSVLQLVHPRPVYGVAYSPGGRFLVTGCHDHTVRIWDARTGKELVKFLHDLEVWHVAFTPDGKHALSVSLDKTMRMWKLPESLVDPRVSATSPAPKPGNKVAKAKLPLRNPRPSGHLAVTDFREIHGVTGAGLKEWFDRLPAGFYPARVTSRAGATPPLFDAVAVRDGRNPTFEAHLALEIKNSQSDFDVMSRSGWALQNSCPYPKDGQILRHHIWILQDGNRWYSYGVLLDSLPESLKRWKRDGLKPKGCALSGPEVGKGVATRHFSILLEPDQGRSWEFFAELSDAELVAELAAARKNGRRPDFVSSLGTDKDRTYSLSVVPNADNLAWHFEGKMSEKRFEAMLAEQKKLGRRPMNVMSEVRGNAIEYTAVWIQYSPAQ